MKNHTISSDRLFLLIDIFRFLWRCISGLSLSEEVVDRLTSEENPRGFSRQALRILGSRLPIPVLLGGVLWVRSGHISAFLLRNREILLRELGQHEWLAFDVIHEISAMVPTLGSYDDVVAFFERIASGEVTEAMLKGVSTEADSIRADSLNDETGDGDLELLAATDDTHLEGCPLVDTSEEPLI